MEWETGIAEWKEGSRKLRDDKIEAGKKQVGKSRTETGRDWDGCKGGGIK